MSQYPTPYPPQQPMYGGYQQPPTPDQLLAPARRAGIMMIVLGVLYVFCGLCMAGMGWVMQQPDFTSQPQYAELQKTIATVEQQAGVSMQTILFMMGLIPLIVGAVTGGLGFFVRGGGMVSVVLSVAVVGIQLLVLGLIIVMGTIQTVATDPSQAIGVCFYIVPFVLLALTLFWLVQAARATTQVAAARQNYQAQLYQYQQYQDSYRQQTGQQQGYPQVPPQQPGMGYQYPPPAQPPQQPPPQPPGDRTDGPPPPG